MRQDFKVLKGVLSDLQTELARMQVAGEFDTDTLIEDMSYLLVTKGQDYSGTNHTWWNFEEMAFVTGITVDQAFLALIGVKIARIKSLKTEQDPGRIPTYESLEDTFLDLANYCVLYVGYQRWERAGKQL